MPGINTAEESLEESQEWAVPRDNTRQIVGQALSAPGFYPRLCQWPQRTLQSGVTRDSMIADSACFRWPALCIIGGPTGHRGPDEARMCVFDAAGRK